jgi:hypothetical protein
MEDAIGFTAAELNALTQAADERVWDLMDDLENTVTGLLKLDEERGRNAIERAIDTIAKLAMVSNTEAVEDAS